jgi:hypothetical protein
MTMATQAVVCGLQEARLELERLIAAGSHDMSLQQLCGAFPYTLDAFQQRSVESFLQGKSAAKHYQMRSNNYEHLHRLRGFVAFILDGCQAILR